jgi:hypothetical protein
LQIVWVSLLVVPAAGAQEKSREDFPYTLGGGIEYGLNTRENFAMGYTVALDRFFFIPIFSVGIRGTMYNDFKSITATEAELTMRLSFLKIGPGDIFTQLGWGWAFYQEDDRKISTYIMDAALGYRFFFLGGFYVEPFVRGGYPFEVNIGVLAGHWFSF